MTPSCQHVSLNDTTPSLTGIVVVIAIAVMAKMWEEKEEAKHQARCELSKQRRTRQGYRLNLDHSGNKR